MATKREPNQNGDLPSNTPSKSLINPPNKENAIKPSGNRSDKNSTGKDPNLGGRQTTR